MGKKQDRDDTKATMTAAGLMLLAGYALHDPLTSLDGRRAAALMLDRLLVLAHQHRFPKADILTSLFAKREKSPRMFKLCLEAVKDIPPNLIRQTFIDAGLTGQTP